MLNIGITIYIISLILDYFLVIKPKKVQKRNLEQAKRVKKEKVQVHQDYVEQINWIDYQLTDLYQSLGFESTYYPEAKVRSKIEQLENKKRKLEAKCN